MSGLEAPGIIAAISAAATVAGTAVSMIGAQQQGQAEKQAAQYQAQVAANNAIIQQQNAAQATQAGQAAAETQQMKTRAQAGAIKAGIGASGVDINSPSAEGVLSSQAQLGALDQMTIQSNYSKQTYGYQVAAGSQEAQSKLDISTANNAPIAANYRSASSLLSGVSSLGTQYGRWQYSSGTPYGSTTTDTTTPQLITDAAKTGPVSATFF